MTELIFRFTPEELEVLQALIEFHSGCEIPEWLSEDAYDSLFDKVMSNQNGKIQSNSYAYRGT